MAHKVLNSLLQDVHQVSKAIAADTLQQSETVRQVGEVLDALQATLKNRKCPTSEQAEYAIYLLRAERYRQTYIHGKPFTDACQLSRLIAALKAIRRRLEVTEDTWRYRRWEACWAAAIMAGIFILPAYLIFSLAVWAGCDSYKSSVVLGAYLVCVTGAAFWSKDCVAIYWSLYGFIPLLILNGDLGFSFFSIPS